MPTKTSAIISVILTILVLILIGVLSIFMNMVALNGMSSREGVPALLTLGSCSIIGIILSAVVASRLTKTFISKYSWNSILAVIIAFIAGSILGFIFNVIGFVLAIIVADILWPL
jgi:hypothetical protein